MSVTASREDLREEIKSELLRVAKELPPEQIPRFFGDLEEIRRTAEMQLRVATISQPEGDALLTVAGASERLGVSKDTLYRKEFPFTRHVGRSRRFSRNGIDAAIRRNDLTPERTDVNLTHPKRRKRLN
jgi:excisionase family DNA binding protein